MNNDEIKILNDGMLELQVDNRSGTKLELVLLVYNEEKRLPNIIKYYGEKCDIVLLDGGSSDGTVNYAIENNCTVYRRRGPEWVGENHFVHYANEVTKSGYCFYMMADEFIEIKDLMDAYDKLMEMECYIGIRKIEWIYCEAPKTPKKTTRLPMPRGFRSGTAAYNPNFLHDSLHYQPPTGSAIKYFIYDLDHLHIKSIKNEYGKYGNYINTEISSFISNGNIVYPYVRRYIVPLILSALWRIWINKTSISRKIIKLIEFSIMAQLALISLLEQKYMPSVNKQREIYSHKYR